MNVGVTSAILASVVSSTVAIAILLKRPRLRIYSHFAAFTLAIFAYHTGSLISQIADGAISGVPNVALALMAPLSILFFRELVRDHRRTTRQYLRISVVISGFFSALIFSPLGNHTMVRLALGAFVLLCGAAVIQMLYRHSLAAPSDTERVRIRYLLFGAGISLALSAAKAITSSTLFAAMGHLSITFYVYFLYQSIISRRLIHLVELLGKTAVLGVLTLMLAIIYSLLVLWVGRDQPGLWFFNTIVASFVILILYDQIRPWVETITVKLFFRKHYEFRKLALEVARSLRTTITIERMVEKLLQGFSQSGSQIGIYLQQDRNMTYRLMGFSGSPHPESLSLSQHPTLLQHLRQQQGPLILEELINRVGSTPALVTQDNATEQRKLERVRESIDVLRQLHASVVLPMRSENQIVGLLTLGPEQISQSAVQEYSADDVAALMSMAEACAVVVENSQEYEKQRERDRLVEIGEMATGMAHEIRNPLGAMKGAAQCLDLKTLPEEQREFVDVIVEEVNRLNGVVVQFLDYARPYRGNPIPTNVNNIVDATLTLFGHDKIPGNVTIEKDLGHELPEVSIDPEQLKQVLLNLFSNAVHAMPEGGTLKIQSFETHDTQTKGAQHSHSLADARVCIRIQDTGCGIPSKILHRIFVPFFTTKSKGTGLGLAISQRIIENTGGRIEVSSESGKGTTFTLKIPRVSVSEP